MKMTQRSALYFPETIPTLAAVAPLLLILDKLNHYRPTESPLPTAPLFAETGLVQGYAPAPLGDDLNFFLRLVKDLRAHAQEYSGNFLSSLSPSLAGNYQEESVQQVIRAMTNESQQQPQETKHRDEGFWRTRLLLQLAEEMYRDEGEINDHLAKVSNMQQRMLQSLHDSNDDDEDLPLPTMPTSPSRLPIRDDLLCRAWCRLFLADQNQQRPALLATANIEAAEQIIDTYTQQSQQAPITICTLPLPTLTGINEEDYLAQRTTFHTSAANILTEIHQAMQTAMKNGQTTLDQEKISAQWQAALSPAFTTTAPGTSQLQITLLKDVTFADLCQRLGKSDENNSAPGEPHTVLIHLTPLF